MRIGKRVGALFLAGRASLFGVLCVGLGIALVACGSKQSGGKLDADMARIVAEKRALAKEIAASQTNRVSREVWRFFDLVERDDWSQTTNLFARLQKESGQYQGATKSRGLSSLLNHLFAPPRSPSLNSMLWCPIQETFGIGESFHEWDHSLLQRFGRDVIDSIPADSIYFGGTDPGRFVITALSRSHREGKPFFVLTQNALADGRYLDYLRRMYGGKIYIPTASDSQAAFTNYLQDAQQRMQTGQLKAGEDVKIVNNSIQVSGQTAVMAVNALLVKTIFDQNPDHAFYVEESFPLEWMYRYLSPHGLILKLNRDPLPELGETSIQKDREYWQRYTARLIGDWLTPETTVKEVCDFAERVYLRKDLGTFAGDKAFAQNTMAQRSFSKLRNSIAGVYAWRHDHAATPEEKARMAREADLAFRQALALCPCLPEAVYRYTNLLVSQKRIEEAQLVAETWRRLDPANPHVGPLLQQLKKAQ